VAWDADDHAVVKLGLAAVGVTANVVRMEQVPGEIAAAPLAFAVGGDKELTNLPRREETATVPAEHD
jgi:hypothetical protein